MLSSHKPSSTSAPQFINRSCIFPLFYILGSPPPIPNSKSFGIDSHSIYLFQLGSFLFLFPQLVPCWTTSLGLRVMKVLLFEYASPHLIPYVRWSVCCNPLFSIHYPLWLDHIRFRVPLFSRLTVLYQCHLSFPMFKNSSFENLVLQQLHRLL